LAPFLAQGEVMSETRDEITLQIYAALDAYERALDVASAAGADLAGALPRARISAKFAAEVGQEAFSHVISSLGGLAEARGRLVEGHRALALVRRQMKLPVVSFGDKAGIPNASAIEFENRPVHAA
jgi:hypothetical protein